MIHPFRSCAWFILAVAAVSGCRSIPYDTQGETVAVFQFGEFKMLLNTSAPKAAKATQVALRQLDLYQTETTVNRFDARFTARARNDQKVLIIIQEVNSVQTLVRIRWGEGGEMNASRRLFDTIEANVGR